MPSAKDVTIDTEFFKVLVVGPPGTGKSVLASTFPTPGFVFDFAGGIITYRGLDFDYEQYPLSAAGWTKFEVDFRNTKKAVDDGKYATVIVDDCSAMTDLAMEQALKLDVKRSPTGGPIWNIHYMMVRNLMEGRLRQLLDLPCNIVLIAHMDVTLDDDGRVVKISPLMTGQLSIKIPGYFDEVYYSSVRKTDKGLQWVLQTVPIGLKEARSRLSGKQRLLPDYMPNDYNEIIKIVRKAAAQINKKKEN